MGPRQLGIQNLDACVIFEHTDRTVHQPESYDAEHSSKDLQRQPVGACDKIERKGCPDDAEEEKEEHGRLIPSDKDRQALGEVVYT